MIPIPSEETKKAVSREDRAAQLAPVDKALSVFLPLEPLIRPKKLRKLIVGTQTNPLL